MVAQSVLVGGSHQLLGGSHQLPFFLPAMAHAEERVELLRDFKLHSCFFQSTQAQTIQVSNICHTNDEGGV